MFVDQVRDGLFFKAEVVTAVANAGVSWPTDPKMTFAHGGAVQTNTARCSVAELTGSITGGNHRSAGVALTGPDSIAKDAEEFVPYRVRGMMTGTSSSLGFFFFAGIGPASPGSDAAGYATHHTIPIGHTTSYGAVCDEILYASPFGTVDSAFLTTTSL